MILVRSIIAAEFDGDDLRLALIEHRPLLRKRWRLAELATIGEAATLPPAKLAEEVAAFLRRHRAQHAPLVLALARRETIVRRLALPLEAESTLAKAVSYQVDSLHPFDPDEVRWDYAVLGKDESRREIQVMVYIAHRRAVEEPIERLRRAGLKPVALVPTAAAFYRLLAGVAGERARRASVIAFWRGEQVEFLAIEDNQLTLSREAEWPAGGATPEWFAAEVAAVRAQMQAREEAPELLLCGETPAWVNRESQLGLVSLASALDWDFRQPEGVDWVRQAGLIAAGYAALARRGPGRVNLLPTSLRVIERRWTLVPTYALAAIVLLLGATLGARSLISDALYARALGREIRKLEPAVAKVRQLDDHSRALADRVEAIEGLRRQTRLKLQVIGELTRLFPPDAWVQTLQVGEDTVEITGYAGAASSLLPLLEDSPLLEKVEFLSAITRTAEGKELFRLRARITGARPLAQEGSQP